MWLGPIRRENFTKQYFDDLWEWINNGGAGHVAAYLAKQDIRAFSAKAPPLKTPAFWAIVDSNRAPEESELPDVIEKLGNPKAFTLNEVIARGRQGRQG